MLPLIQSGELSFNLTNMNILNQYNAIEDGTYQAVISSIFSLNPYDNNSLMDNQTQSTGGYLYSIA